MERSDKIGLSVAAAGHVLLLAVLSFGLFKAPKAPVVKQPTIDVSLVDAVALESSTRSPAAPTTAQAPETGPIEDAAPAPSPEPEPVAKPEPAPPPPPPTPRAQPKPEPKPEPRPVAKPVPKPVAKKPEPPKPVPQKPKPAAAPPEAKKTPPAKPVAKPSASPSKSTTPAKSATTKSSSVTQKPSNVSGTGDGKKRTAFNIDLSDVKDGSDDSKSAQTGRPVPFGPTEKRALVTAISNQLKNYWNPPSGADVEQLVTSLRWRLNKDGSIASGPDFIAQRGQTDSNRPQQQPHIEAAKRAVRRAAPFKLPVELYDQWKLIGPFDFDNRLAQ